MFDLLKLTCPFCGGKIIYQSVTTNHEVVTEVEVECGRCKTEFKLHSDPVVVSISFDDSVADVLCTGKDALENGMRW